MRERERVCESESVRERVCANVGEKESAGMCEKE